MVAAIQRMKLIEVYCGREEKTAVKKRAEQRRQTVSAIVAAWIAPRLERLPDPERPFSEESPGAAGDVWTHQWPLPRVRLSRHRIPVAMFQALRMEAARQGVSIPGLLYAWIAPELQRLSEDAIGET